MEDLPDFKRLSTITRRNLAITAKSLQLRIVQAAEKLSELDFRDLWNGNGNVKGVGGPVYQSYAAFRSFLISYVTHTYGSWPPLQSTAWLNRDLVFNLQKDFGALYGYLVDRDVIWDSREERPGKKWQIVNTKEADFKADPK